MPTARRESADSLQTETSQIAVSNGWVADAPDGQGYDALLRDMTDEKCGYAALTDESGVIRQSKAIDCEI